MSINLLLFKLTLLGYSGATVFYLLDVIKRKEKLGLIALQVLRATFAVHLVTLVVRFVEIGYTPVTNLHRITSYNVCYTKLLRYPLS